jgi:hypothetical protein
MDLDDGMRRLDDNNDGQGNVVNDAENSKEDEDDGDGVVPVDKVGRRVFGTVLFLLVLKEHLARAKRRLGILEGRNHAACSLILAQALHIADGCRMSCAGTDVTYRVQTEGGRRM